MSASRLMNSTLYPRKKRGYVSWLKAFYFLGTKFKW